MSTTITTNADGTLRVKQPKAIQEDGLDDIWGDTPAVVGLKAGGSSSSGGEVAKMTGRQPKEPRESKPTLSCEGASGQKYFPQSTWTGLEFPSEAETRKAFKSLLLATALWANDEGQRAASIRPRGAWP